MKYRIPIATTIATSLFLTCGFDCSARPDSTIRHDASKLDKLTINGKNYKWCDIRDLGEIRQPVGNQYKLLGEHHIDPSLALFVEFERALRKPDCRYFLGATITLSGARSCLTAAGSGRGLDGGKASETSSPFH